MDCSVYLEEGEATPGSAPLSGQSGKMAWGSGARRSPALQLGWVWVVAAEAAATDRQGGDGLGARVVHTHVQRERPLTLRTGPPWAPAR